MIRSSVTLFLMLFLVNLSFAQIVVNQSDMPSPGDTVRLSVGMGLGTLDPSATGQGYTWDYSSLTPMTQQVDTFISVSSTPFIFQLVFNNPTDPNRATLAQRQALLDFIPGLSLSDVYSFYRSTSSVYSFVGYAGEFSGIPLPAKFSSPDILYKFPMQFGNVDSAVALLNFSFPGMGTLYIERNRRNFVDGYGTLTTPYGTHQVLKLRSEVAEYDSVYLDTLGQGIAITRNYTEYKWIGKGFDLPLLQVTQEGPMQTITYVDSVRVTNPGITAWRKSGLSFDLWPNPSPGSVDLAFHNDKGGSVGLQVLDMTGRLLMQKDLGYMSPGDHQVHLAHQSLPPGPGSYLIRLTLPNGSSARILLRQ